MLQNKITEFSLSNISLISPVSRKELIEYYKKADILFLHLKNLSAFERVLPSKIFDYGPLGVPIVAGVKGYAREFIKQNLPHSLIFEPSNVEECISCLYKSNKIVVNPVHVQTFKEKFSRKRIMSQMAHDIKCIVN